MAVIVTLTGYMGSGKTETGKELARLLGMPFVDLDAYIKERTGLAPAQIIEEKGESIFRVYEHRLLRELLDTYDHAVLSTGGGTFVQPENRKLLKEKTFTVFLDAPFALLRRRLDRAYVRRPLLPRAADGKPDWKAVENHYRSRLASYEKADVRVVNNFSSPLETAEFIARRILNAKR